MPSTSDYLTASVPPPPPEKDPQAYSYVERRAPPFDHVIRYSSTAFFFTIAPWEFDLGPGQAPQNSLGLT
jgi:hypothetical protein